MEVRFDIAGYLESITAAAAHELAWADGGFSPDVRVADPRFGDFQANGILPFAKRTKQNPRQLAQTLVDHLNQSGVLENVARATIAGPGFMNFALDRKSVV